MKEATVFNFTKTSETSNWNIVNDAVMGGKSVGIFHVNEKGNGVFKGEVSLENNGGFSSLKYRFNEMNTKQYFVNFVFLR